MNTIAITKSTIIQELSRIPETSLYTVKMYLDTLLTDVQASSLKNQSLRGIWKDQGFEKIVNLPKELHQIRQELQEHILQRTL
jgi:uncharacterized lipoprotein YddW (UPF0748 family)